MFAEAALAGAPFGVALVDADLRCLWVNGAFSSVTGLDIHQHAGRRISAVLPESCSGAEDRVREVLQSGRPLTNVPLSTAHDGRHRRWNATIFPVHADSLNPRGTCCVCIDVSDVSLLVEQFLQSQKLEAVGLLANLVAHDFNNLLTVIQGYSDLLLRDASDEAKRTMWLGEIRTAAEAAGHLSRQLLTLSRRNTGAIGPVDVNLLVRAISGMLRRILPANVRHELVLAENLGLTLADPGQVEHILMNLITNAIDAMPGGGVLTIETANTSRVTPVDDGDELEAGDYVTLSVTDTGAGMDAGTQALLAAPLFAAKMPGQGTGLGLSAARMMAQQMHGRMHGVSALGKGSRFTLDLPAVRSAVAASAAEPPPAPGTQTATLLLVEDHEVVRRSMVTVLEDAGYTVIATGSGAEALEAVAGRQGAIDLLLADVELPDTDGATLAERLRNARPGMRVLLTSGLGDRSPSPGHAPLHGHALLGKPFSVNELLQKIRTTLQPAVAADQANSRRLQ
jgi:two-component system cell cycle sensor histidine kinase/response regulator CckA